MSGVGRRKRRTDLCSKGLWVGFELLVDLGLAMASAGDCRLLGLYRLIL